MVSEFLCNRDEDGFVIELKLREKRLLRNLTFKKHFERNTAIPFGKNTFDGKAISLARYLDLTCCVGEIFGFIDSN